MHWTDLRKEEWWKLWISASAIYLECKNYWEFCSFFPVLGYWSQMQTTSWWGGIFENQKMFFIIRYPYTKSFSVLQQLSRFERFSLISAAYFFRDFKYLMFSCFSVPIAGQILIDWRRIFKNQEIFLSIMDPFTKTSLRFYTGVTNWEIWKLLWHLFSRNSPYLPRIRFVIFSQLVELVS